jgi:hypothetical protein
MADTGFSQGRERAKGFARQQQEVVEKGRGNLAFFVGALPVFSRWQLF